jgi:hypothetical protein
MEGLEGLVTRGDGRVGAHVRPAEDEDQEEGGGGEEPDGGGRRSGTRGAAARRSLGHQRWFGIGQCCCSSVFPTVEFVSQTRMPFFHRKRDRLGWFASSS